MDKLTERIKHLERIDRWLTVGILLCCVWIIVFAILLGGGRL